MTKKSIVKIQNQIIQLLPPNRQKHPGVLFTDSCSEVARLAASWIRKELDKTNRILILKGDKVCGTKKSHDILAVLSNNKVYVIDPTIWQFFPKEKSILVFQQESIDAAINKIKDKYGGQWAISEKFTQLSKNDEKKYLKIISQNINENL